MQRFKSSGQAQDFLSAHPFIYRHFHPRRDRLAANAYRAIRPDAFKTWQQETSARHTA
jgi:putative transposase